MILNDYWRKLRETNAKSLIFFPTSTNNLTTINNKTPSSSSPLTPKISRPKSVTPPSVTNTATTTTTHTTINSIISNPMVTQTPPPPHQLVLQPPSQPPPPPPPQPVTYTPTTPAPTPTPTGIYDTTTTYSRAPSRPALFYNNRHFHHHHHALQHLPHGSNLHHTSAAAPPFIPAHQIVRLNHPSSQQHQLTPQRKFHPINKQQQQPLLRSQPAQINRMGVRSACNSSRVQLNHLSTIVNTTPNHYHPHHTTTISSLSSSPHPSNTNPRFMVRAQTTMMNQRQYTSATLNKLMSTPQNNNHQQQQQQNAHYEPYLDNDIVGGGGDDDNEDDDPTTSADPEFYEGLNYSGRADSAHGPPNLADDIYDFSMLKPSLRLESSSNNPTDDEDEGMC